jgi:superfamily II DNA or RNA helicase
MAVVTLTDDEQALRDAVGTSVLLQGRKLAQTDASPSVAVDLSRGRVTGWVPEGDRRHQLRLDLRHDSGGRLTAVEGWCDCGRAVPCPHAVALLLAAGRQSLARRPAGTPATGAPALGPPAAAESAAGPSAIAPPAPEPPAVESPAPWEGALTAVLANRPAQEPPPRRRANTPAVPARPPLALQFELTTGSQGMVAVRPVVPGRTGGWVRSGISWSMLQYAEYYYRHLPPLQVGLLQELCSLSRRASYATVDKILFLDSITSRRVWDLLLEAQELGLPLIRSGRQAEPVRIHADPAVARLAITRSDGEIVVAPQLEVAEQPVTLPVLPLGEPTHGVGWLPAGASGPLDLARLAAPPPRLFVQLTEAGPLRIPAAGEERFFSTYYPQLIQQLEVVCRDGSITLPAMEPPVLTLTVTGLGGHRVELAWAWGYQVGAARRTEPLQLPAGRPAPGRDADAENRTLDDVTPLLAELPSLLSPSSSRPRPVQGARLDGVDTARFVAEVVPRLTTHPQVEVRLALDDQPREYREADEAPVVRFEASAEAANAGRLGAQDWFDLAVTVTVAGHQVPFEPLFTALAQGLPSLLLDNGVYFRLDRPELAELARLIAESRELLDAPPATVRLTRYHAGVWDDLERLGAVTGEVNSWREAVKALGSAEDLPEHKAPAGLQVTLRHYQEQGFGWLTTLWSLRLGGILADDMGLGKTLQALSLILHTREQNLTDLPFLVVAPTSVVTGWANEAARFAPDLRVAVIAQTTHRRGHDLETAITGADLVVTSYTLFRLEFEEYRSQSWAGLMLDEAQNVKNHQSTGYRCARQLPAEIKIAISGTPIENNLMELWSLLSITAPGLFPRADRFTGYYRNPIERDQDAEKLAQLRRRIRPLLLRRTKNQVARELPDRQEQILEVELHSRHRSAYSRYLQRERQKVLGLLGDLQHNRFEIFRSLTLLRQASLDVSLVDPGLASVPATKLDALLDQLEDIVAEGHRVLVFSQFTRFLGRARNRLEAAGIRYSYLDGRTRNRSKVITGFREGTAPVFLISLKAGGSGLTLTEADYVILLDPWWNPATEAQAVDRAHRIGQTRKVMVYRMVAKDTIEEKVMALKERKAALTASVLAGDDFASASLTAEDIRHLLT